MRRWLRLLAAALLAAGAAMLLLPGGTAAAATVKVGVIQQSWFWQTAYEQANPPVAQSLPATEPSGVPDGDLAVAYSGSADKSSSKMTALSFDVSAVSAGSTIDGFTFSLTLDSAPPATSFGAPSAAIVACQPTRSWPVANGGDYTDQPTVDCAHKVAPSVNGSIYTFKIPAIAQTWVDDQNLGVAILADPDAAAAPFQLVFASAKDVKADISFSPAAAVTKSSGSSAGSGSVVVPVTSGNSAGASGPVNVSLPPATTAQPGAAPVVAASAAPAAPATRPLAAATTAPSIPTKAFWAAALVLGALLLLASLVLGDPTPVAPAAAGSRLDQVLRSRRTATETS